MRQYNVTGMSCAACSSRVEKAVSEVPGVNNCSVNLLTNSMSVDGDASDEIIIKAVEDAGYGASIKGKNVSANSEENITATSWSKELTEAGNFKLPPLLVNGIGIAALGFQAEIEQLGSTLTKLGRVEAEHGTVAADKDLHGIKRPHSHIAHCAAGSALIRRSDGAGAVLDDFEVAVLCKCQNLVHLAGNAAVMEKQNCF